MSALTHGATKLRTVSDHPDMLAKMVADGKERVEELEHELARSKSLRDITQHMADTHQSVVDAAEYTLSETRRTNLLVYAFTADPENNQTVGDCIEWLKEHPEAYEAFGVTPE